MWLWNGTQLTNLDRYDILVIECVEETQFLLIALRCAPAHPLTEGGTPQEEGITRLRVCLLSANSPQPLKEAMAQILSYLSAGEHLVDVAEFAEDPK